MGTENKTEPAFQPTREQEEVAEKIRAAGGTVLRTPLTNPDGSLNEKTCDDLLDLLGQNEEQKK